MGWGAQDLNGFPLLLLLEGSVHLERKEDFHDMQRDIFYGK